MGIIIALVEKIRARVRQEKLDEKEREKQGLIAAIDAEFQEL